MTIVFQDTSANATTWSWDIDNDGDEDYNTQNPSHEYTTFGTYTVNLTAGNGHSTDSEVKVDYITVYNATPVANFTTDVTTGCVPTTVTFTDTSTGNNLTWSWKLNGVEFSTDQNPTHEFTVPGLYEWLNLTVTNDGGSNTTSWQDSFYFVDCAPDPITGLTNDTGTCEQLTFNWTNPSNANFNHTYVMKDSVFDQNVSNASHSVTWTGLTGGTDHICSARRQ